MSERRWKVADAKARLSELVHEARQEPQIIENRGRAIVAVLSVEAYRKLKAAEARAAPARRLASFLQFSEELRRSGGAELEAPPRRPRRSPFED